MMTIATMPRTEYGSRYAASQALMAKAGSPDVVRYLTTVAGENRYAWPDLAHYTDQVLQYSKSPWVYVAVSKISRFVAQAELEVFSRQGEKLTPINNHPIEVLLQHPSPEVSRFELMEATTGFRELTGNAYWILDGQPGGEPDGIYSLRPDRVRVVAGSGKKLVGGYVYTINGIDIPLEAEEIIHFKRFNPLNDYYGLSAMEAAALAILTDASMSKWGLNFFSKENAIPAGVVNVKRPVQDMEFERIKRRWNENYGGAARKTAFLTETDMSYQDIGMSQRDMDFESGRKFNRQEVFDVFGIMPGMLDPNATEANATAAKETFLSDTIWPILVEQGEKLTVSLAPFWSDNLVIKPKEIRQTPAAQLRAELLSEAPYLAINEVRQKYWGFDPVLWGDGPASGSGAVIISGQPVGKPTFVPKPDQMQLTPDDQQARQDAEDTTAGDDYETGKGYLTRAARKELEQFGRFAAKRLDQREKIETFSFRHVPESVALGVKAYADICEDDHDFEVFSTLPYKASGTDAFAKLRSKGVRQLSSATATYLEGLQADILSGVKHVGANPKALQAYFNARYWADTQKQMSAMLIPIYADIIDQAATQQADKMEMFYGLPVDPGALPKASNDAAVQWANEIVPGLVATTRDGLLALLNRMSVQHTPIKGGPDDKSWLQQLIDAIINSPLFGAARAAMIAISEAARGIVAGILAGLDLASDGGQNVPLMYYEAEARGMIPLHVKCDCYWEDQPVYKGDRLVGITLVWRHPKNSNDEQCQRCSSREDQTYDDVMKIAASEGALLKEVV